MAGDAARRRTVASLLDFHLLYIVPFAKFNIHCLIFWCKTPLDFCTTAALGLFSCLGHRLGRTPPYAVQSAAVLRKLLPVVRQRYRQASVPHVVRPLRLGCLRTSRRRRRRRRCRCRRSLLLLLFARSLRCRLLGLQQGSHILSHLWRQPSTLRLPHHLHQRRLALLALLHSTAACCPWLLHEATVPAARRRGRVRRGAIGALRWRDTRRGVCSAAFDVCSRIQQHLSSWQHHQAGKVRRITNKKTGISKERESRRDARSHTFAYIFPVSDTDFHHYRVRGEGLMRLAARPRSAYQAGSCWVRPRRSERPPAGLARWPRCGFVVRAIRANPCYSVLIRGSVLIRANPC